MGQFRPFPDLAICIASPSGRESISAPVLPEYSIDPMRAHSCNTVAIADTDCVGFPPTCAAPQNLTARRHFREAPGEKNGRASTIHLGTIHCVVQGAGFGLVRKSPRLKSIRISSYLPFTFWRLSRRLGVCVAIFRIYLTTGGGVAGRGGRPIVHFQGIC